MNRGEILNCVTKSDSFFLDSAFLFRNKRSGIKIRRAELNVRDPSAGGRSRVYCLKHAAVFCFEKNRCLPLSYHTPPEGCALKFLVQTVACLFIGMACDHVRVSTCGLPRYIKYAASGRQECNTVSVLPIKIN